MDDAFLEQLLNEEESASLDVKRGQYAFGGAAEEDKAELLKDILAFANAWRRETAYILRGVDEVRGGRSVPVGVDVHLNDHELQQFVNSKTNRTVTFRYIAYAFEGVQLGIIEIPIQERPRYLTEQFGRLPAGVVFVRRGSSTAMASPEEIASMGAATATTSRPVPTLALEWGEPHSRRLMGQLAEITVDVLKPKLNPAVLASPREFMGLGDSSPDYPRELVEFTFESNLLRPLHLVLHNRGQVSAGTVAIAGRLPRAKGLRLADWPPQRPQRHGPLLVSQFRSPIAIPRPEVDEHADHWALQIPFGTILPGQTIWSESPLHIGADHPTRIDLPVQIMAENIPVPLELTLSVVIRVTTRKMEVADTEDPDDPYRKHS